MHLPKFLLVLFTALLMFTHSYAQINKDIFVFEKDGKKGYINHKFEIIAAAEYQELGGIREAFFGNFSIFKIHDKYGVMNLEGKHIIPATYDHLSNTASPGIFVFERNNKYGLLNTKGIELLAPKYEYIVGLSNGGKLVVISENKKNGLIDQQGRVLASTTYDHISNDFNAALLPFAINGKYGFLDHKGKEKIKPVFESSTSFHNKYAAVKQNGKWGFIDKKGKVVIEPGYQMISFKRSFKDSSSPESSSNFYYVMSNDKVGLLDENLNIIVKPIYDEIRNFSDGYAVVSIDKKYGFIDEAGKVVVPLQYEEADYFSEGLAPVVRDGKWGFIDKDNHVLIDFKFPGCVKPFSDGLAVYRQRYFDTSRGHYVNDQCGYINKKGAIEIKTVYKDAQNFNRGIAVVQDAQSEYLINKDAEKVVLKPKLSGIDLLELEFN